MTEQTAPLEAASAFPFDAADDAMRGVLDAAGPAVTGPSPCPEWTGVDVLQHLIDTERSFMEKVGFDLGPAPTATEPIVRWSAHADQLRPLLARPDVLATPYSTPMGDSSVAGMLSLIYGFDLLVHRWDVARSAGADTRFTDAELDAMEASIAQLADVLYSPGAFVEGVTPPPGADRQTRVLATLGRKA
jgi:uncharacterized protein (TIGR03086 family)